MENNTCFNGKAHKFEPRYEEKSRNRPIGHINNITSKELRELMYYKVYVHDICICCGKVVKREDSHVLEKPKCNCGEISVYGVATHQEKEQKVTYELPNTWICPAHGYKKR